MGPPLLHLCIGVRAIYLSSLPFPSGFSRGHLCDIHSQIPGVGPGETWLILCLQNAQSCPSGSQDLLPGPKGPGNPAFSSKASQAPGCTESNGCARNAEAAHHLPLPAHSSWTLSQNLPDCCTFTFTRAHRTPGAPFRPRVPLPSCPAVPRLAGPRLTSLPGHQHSQWPWPLLPR